MAKLVSKVYGDAMYALATEQPDRMDELQKEAEAIASILQEDPEFIQIMNHPEVSEEEKQSLLDTVWQGKISDETLELLHLLVEKHHFESVVDVMNYFVDEVKEYRKIGKCTVTVPMELSDEKKKAIENRLLETTEYKSLEIAYEIDPSLIGGMQIRIGDRVVDSSVKTRLNDLAHSLSQIQLR